LTLSDRCDSLERGTVSLTAVPAKKYSAEQTVKLLCKLLVTALLYMSATVTAEIGAGESLVGAWKLHSFAFVKADGTTKYPFGEHPDGIVMYDSKGRVSVQITRGDVPPFSTRDRDEASDEELRIAYEGFIGYYGTYEVSDSRQLLTIHVAGSSYPKLGREDPETSLRA
jgi:hypothetical protein